MTQSDTRDVPVLIVGTLLPSLQQAVEASYQATRYWELADPQAWLAANGAYVRALVTTGAWGATAELIAQLPKLEGIFSFGAGYDSIAINAARDRGDQHAQCAGRLRGRYGLGADSRLLTAVQ